MFRLRCDRKQPCESCIRLGQASACSFAFPQLSRASAKGPIEPAIRDTLQERIDQLELLARSLVGKLQDKTATSTPGSAVSSEATALIGNEDPLACHFGRMNLQAHESSYVESDHWTAILDEISDLKDMVKEQSDGFHDENREEPQTLPGVDLFLLQSYPITKMEILAALPPRLVIDSIIAKYFKTADMPVALVIHRRVFFKQYEHFWEDPLGTPIMWVTILFGMMFMVAYCSLFVDGGLDQLDEETLIEYQAIVTVSREKMIQCLRMGNYMKGSPHTIEALLSFLQVEYTQGEDTQQGCWQLIGVIVRVALKMGYHRDGSHFPEMSAFEAEMRRRTWYILTQFDTASASQVGLPRLIKQAQYDTAEPRNLLDEDFDDTTTTLPPARPQSEHTLAQFLVYKSRVVSVYGMICDFTTSSIQRDYVETMGLDRKLNAVYASKPPVLELKPMHRSIMDGADLITRRLYLATSFHHAQMSLHRKFMIMAKTDSKYSLSHTICIDAALVVLQLQADMFEQCKPGRMLYANRWKVLLLIQSEFLLATTILCFNLDDDVTNARWGTSPLSSDEVYQKTVTALQCSEAIWKQQQDVSKEAQTAVKAINFVLAKTQSKAGIVSPGLVLGSQLKDSSSWSPSTTTTSIAGMGIYQGGNTVSPVPMLNSDGLSTQVLSSSSFNPSAPRDYASASILSGVQAEPEDGAGGEFFDMDSSWDTWFQL